MLSTSYEAKKSESQAPGLFVSPKGRITYLTIITLLLLLQKLRSGCFAN